MPMLSEHIQFKTSSQLKHALKASTDQCCMLNAQCCQALMLS